eukprot:Em0001g1166a
MMPNVESRLATRLGQPKSITTNQIYGRLNLTLIRANSRAILSRLQILILLFHLTRHCKFTPFSQRLWSPKKNYPAHWTLACSICCWKPPPMLTKHNCFLFPHHMHHPGCLFYHHRGWVYILMHQVHEVAIKWWLGMDTSQGSQCALCPDNALNLWDIMPPLVSVAVMWWYDTTPFVMFWLKHATGPILASKWKLAMTPQPIIATPILLTFC